MSTRLDNLEERFFTLRNTIIDAAQKDLAEVVVCSEERLLHDLAINIADRCLLTKLINKANSTNSDATSSFCFSMASRIAALYKSRTEVGDDYLKDIL
jgi:hypothetical protein